MNANASCQFDENVWQEEQPNYEYREGKNRSAGYDRVRIFTPSRNNWNKKEQKSPEDYKSQPKHDYNQQSWKNLNEDNERSKWRNRQSYDRGGKSNWGNRFEQGGHDDSVKPNWRKRNSDENTRSNWRQGNNDDSARSNWRQRHNDEGRNSSQNDKMIMKVSQLYIGRIIGRQGSRIRILQETSEARIHINPSEGEESIIEISGSESAKEKAKELIEELIEQQQQYENRSEQNNQYRNQRDRTRQETNDTKEEKKQETIKADTPTLNWAELIAASQEEKIKKWAKFPSVKKDFYIEDPEVTSMTSEKVEKLRKEKNNIVVQTLDENDDRNIPNPVENFMQPFKHYPDVIREIEKQQFTDPSPIQCQAWPILMQGYDMIGIAQTGTGKTLAFLLPAFIHIDNQVTPREQRGGPSCLVFAPTRELAQQIERECKKYNYKDIKCVCLYGGGNRKEQINTVEKGVEIVIATPGRLNDLVMHNILDVTCVTYLVLDEADRMLDMGFEPQIKKVLLDIRPDRQTVMTSATWPEGVRRMASQYMKSPMLVFIGSLDIRAVHSVNQEVHIVAEDDKKQILYEFIDSMKPDDKVIVFVDKKVIADDLASDLLLNGIECQSIHGDREQCDREQAIEDLRTGFARILVATDIASRGLDIKDVTHIFNYNFPRNIEEYVHRVGRTGRAGQTGSSITLMTRSDWSKAKHLIEIMEEAEQEVPQELLDMAKRYNVWKEKRDAEDAGARKYGKPGRFDKNRRDRPF